MPNFPDLATLNAWLEQRCLERWESAAHGTLPGTIAEVWAAEKTALMPVPPAFDGFVEQSKRVSPTCLISFDRTRYSIPASCAATGFRRPRPVAPRRPLADPGWPGTCSRPHGEGVRAARRRGGHRWRHRGRAPMAAGRRLPAPDPAGRVGRRSARTRSIQPMVGLNVRRTAQRA
uniref:Uncharacterized protein n=1 Tax=Cereibacter sphaeroides (strain ATCC 17025 / ATH 2.4.3) TaxID=349102 RepID=A4X016_CERS5